MEARTIEPFLAQNILTVRALLDQALREARRSGELQRLTAVVLLDAANERVLHLVAVTLGLPIGARTQFEDLVAQVRERLGDAWSPRSLSDIRRLHRARNSVQHEGLGADRNDVASWMASTTEFVATLVEAAFEVPLSDVRLSSAVATQDIRTQLVAAELALAAGQWEAAVVAADEAFTTARASWVRLHERGRSGLIHRPFMSDISSRAEFDYLEQLAQEARNAALLYPLAADPGEVGWFLDLSSEPGTTTEAEAQRAVSFVFWWVVNWEAASFDPTDRRTAWERAQRQVRSDPDLPARLVDLRVDDSYGRRQILVAILRDVPADEEAFSAWSRDVGNLLREGPIAGVDYVSVGLDGSIRLAVDVDVDVEALVGQIKEVLARAELLRTDRDAARRSDADAHRAAVDDWARLWADRRMPNWLANVCLGKSRVSAEGYELHLTLTEELRDLQVATRVAEILRSDQRVAQCYGVGLDDVDLALQPALRPDEFADVLAGADAVLAPAIAEELASREASAVAEAALADRVAGLAARLRREST